MFYKKNRFTVPKWRRILLSIFFGVLLLYAIGSLQIQALYSFLGFSYGTHGRLTVPTLLINVAVYDYVEGINDSQEIVNNEDSAAYLYWPAQDGIADHRSQRFFFLPSAKPGKTKAYLEMPEVTQCYVCSYVGKGTIIRFPDNITLIQDEDGRVCYAINDNGLCIYTCEITENETETDVYKVIVTYWEPIGEINYPCLRDYF